MAAWSATSPKRPGRQHEIACDVLPCLETGIACHRPHGFDGLRVSFDRGWATIAHTNSVIPASRPAEKHRRTVAETALYGQKMIGPEGVLRMLNLFFVGQIQRSSRIVPGVRVQIAASENLKSNIVISMAEPDDVPKPLIKLCFFGPESGIDPMARVRRLRLFFKCNQRTHQRCSCRGEMRSAGLCNSS